jgi:curved DNA-binding protein CbpA
MADPSSSGSTRSHYDVLGLSAAATPDEVRTAYRSAARDSHPDTGGDDQRMRDLNAAWHVLGDPVRRAAYDRHLASREAGGHWGAGPHAPFEAGAWDVDADDHRPGDAWGDLADLADGRPFGPTKALEGWWAILPPATLLAAIGLLLGAFVFGAPGLLAVSGGAFLLALGLFVLAPLRAMTRKPR